MREGTWKARYLLFLVFVSFSTLCLIALIAFLSPHVSDGFAYRRQLTGLIFSALCILGMLAVFFPRHCARSPHEERLTSKRSDFSLHGERDLQKLSWIGGVTVTHGHHPLCDPYRQHEFVLGKKTLCSACMGLFCGALISLAGAWYVFLQQFTYDLPYDFLQQFTYDLPYEIVFTLGVVLIVFGLAPYVVANPLGGAHDVWETGKVNAPCSRGALSYPN